MKNIRIFLLLVLGLASACSAPQIDDQVSGEFAAEGLYPVKHSGFAEAYARRDADLASYREVDIQALGVSDIDIPNTVIAGTLKRDWEMTPQRQASLQQAWAKAMDQAFASYTKSATGKKGLRIAARLTRFAPAMVTATTVGGALQPAGSSRDAIEISAEFRLYNGDDGSLLAVIRDSRSMTAVAMTRTAPVAMTLIFESWAALLHTRVSGK